VNSEIHRDGSRGAGRTPALSAHRVFKRFGSTLALAGVDFAVHPGEIVGLVGANGAGKSTLIGILSGSLAPTEGSIEVDGVVASFRSPDDALTAGIATVQQDVDLALVPDLTVAENLVLDAIASGALGALPSGRRIRRAAAATGGHDLSLGARVSTLRTSQKQQLLIARALHRGARVLILDEPTAALSIVEQRELHTRLRALAADGTAIVYITHHLGEIAAICDRVVALRDGVVAADFASPFTTERVVSAMLGPVATIGHQPRRVDLVAPVAGPVLEAVGVRAFPDAPAIDITVRAGEVLGITGLLGAGKTELLMQLAGAAGLLDGSLRLAGAPYRPRSTGDAIRAGIGFVAEDRRTQGEVGEWDVASNLTLPDLRRYSHGGLLRPRAERRAAAAQIERLKIVASGPRAAIRSLSGGNRQKVLVARWLAAGSRLLILDEPFRGIDLGARADIAGLLRSGAVKAAFVASSDPEEILEVADRIIVVSRGRLVAEVRPDEIDADRLAGLMIADGAEKKDSAA
jgi:simple sugar transport system ATP-binding protein